VEKSTNNACKTIGAGHCRVTSRGGSYKGKQTGAIWDHLRVSTPIIMEQGAGGGWTGVERLSPIIKANIKNQGGGRASGRGKGGNLLLKRKVLLTTAPTEKWRRGDRKRGNDCHSILVPVFRCCEETTANEKNKGKRGGSGLAWKRKDAGLNHLYSGKNLLVRNEPGREVSTWGARSTRIRRKRTPLGPQRADLFGDNCRR